MLDQARNLPGYVKWQCLIALLWVFGKRITENLRLRRRDVKIEGNYVYCRFRVLKKKSRRAKPTPRPYVKRINILNPYSEYIIQFVEAIDDPDQYLFASARSSTGHMSRIHAYKTLKKLNPDCWLHLFRESLATRMAEEGATEEELMHWFDWEKVDTAHEYVKRGTKLTEKWADRKF